MKIEYSINPEELEYYNMINENNPKFIKEHILQKINKLISTEEEMIQSNNENFIEIIGLITKLSILFGRLSQLVEIKNLLADYDIDLEIV